MTTRVTVVDNYDSFTYNLVEYLSAPVAAHEGEHGPPTGGLVADPDDPVAAAVTVLKNAASVDDVRATDPDAIVISPGPGHPKNDRDVGVTMPVLRDLSPEVPTLGVCLGLEAAAYEYGGSVGHAPEPVHGKAFPIDHDGAGVFAGLDQEFQAGRYHSLVATEVPDCFAVSATTDHGGETLVMGIRHREYPIEAVQFHPESVLTGVGHDVIRNFLTGVVRG